MNSVVIASMLAPTFTNSVFMRFPASVDEATQPVSRSVRTSNGEI